MDAPSLTQLRALRDRFGFADDDDQLEQMRALLGATLQAYAFIDSLPSATPLRPKYPRGTARRPTPEENPNGAWAQLGEIRGAPDGPLAGRTVVIKDTVAVAGMELNNGTRVLSGFVPDEDATVVTRLLDAGATIVGKATCENVSLSGGSHTSDPGPVVNAFRAGFSAGGSSSGCGVLVALGEVDLAIGGDQGGSVRVPAAWSGVYGHKPTFGLVPYTGAMSLEASVDHLGPIARTPADLALVLDAIAGPDGLDHRQPRDLVVPDFSAAVSRDVAGLRVGLLTEGFGIAGVSEPDVDALVRERAAMLTELGCVVTEVSVPEHATSGLLCLPVFFEGAMLHTYFGAHGVRADLGGHSSERLADFLATAPHHELNPAARFYAYAGAYAHDVGHGRFYAKVQNLRRGLRAAYDRAFASVDVLVLPTVPLKPVPLPGPDASVAEIVAQTGVSTGNTVAFDLTGHPAIAIPAGMSDGLPVSLMVVAPHFEDARLLTVAAALHDR